MRIKSIVIGFVAVFTINIQAGNNKLINFELKDQFDELHKKSDYVGKIIIIVGSDRKGTEFNSQWVEPLLDSLRINKLDSVVSFISVANLGSVPFFMQSIVQGFFPEDSTNRIIMDWDDLFADEYNFKEDHCNLLIFNFDSNLVFNYAVQDFNQQIFGKLLIKIEQSIIEVK